MSKSRKLFQTNELFIFKDSTHHETILTRIGDFTRQFNRATGDKFESFRAWYKARLSHDSWCMWCDCKKKKEKKKNQFKRYFIWTRKHRKVCRKSIRTRMVNKFSLLFSASLFPFPWNSRFICYFELWFGLSDYIHSSLEVECSVIAWKEAKWNNLSPLYSIVSTSEV